jgi:hypothetical protein
MYSLKLEIEKIINFNKAQGVITMHGFSILP